MKQIDASLAELQPSAQLFSTSGHVALFSEPATTPLGSFYRALVAYSASEFVRAQEFASAAAKADPDDLVFAASVEYLDHVVRRGKQGVYVSPEGFQAFIRGGGNVPLYERTSAALSRLYAGCDQASILDVGAGDGAALLPALRAVARPRHIERVDVVEPSAALMAPLAHELAALGVLGSIASTTIQDFVASAGAERRWALAEATYSLQSLQPHERGPILGWLRAHADSVALVEFDAPEFEQPLSAERAAYVVTRYLRGLAEYTDRPNTDPLGVVQGFMMPVMFGYFDASAARTNYEIPIDSWVAAFRAAGFVDVTRTEVYDYWWAPAVIVHGR